jgi:hypothetical protein
MATPNIRTAMTAIESETVLKLAVSAVGIGIANGAGPVGWVSVGNGGDSPNRSKAHGCDMGVSKEDGAVGGFAADLVS